MKKIGVVVPSNRPDELEKFKEAWSTKIDEAQATLYVIEDKEETWADIKRDLGKNSWIIPVRTDCIRSYGYLMAYRDQCDYIVTLDDDVRPLENNNPIIEHVKLMEETVLEPDNWARTYGDIPSRGLPLMRKIVLSHGLWAGNPDVSGSFQHQFPDLSQSRLPPSSRYNQIIDKGVYYPMSGMNLAWNSGVTPALYFGLQGCDIRDPEKRWGLDRCGDILAGIISKVLIDLNPFMCVHSGDPWILHERKSDPLRNMELEKSGQNVPYVWGEKLKKAQSYLDIADKIHNMKFPSKEYCASMGKAMRIWWDLLKRG